MLGRWTPFAGVGWTKYGTAQYIRLKNGFDANAGANCRVAATDTAGVHYSCRQRIAVGGASQSEFTAYLNHDFSNHVRLQDHAPVARPTAAPDWGAGASVKNTV